MILLDYETNDDVENPTMPLSHASLIKKFIEKKQMKDILRMLLAIGLVLIALVIFSVFDITSLKLLILLCIGMVVAFIITGVQIFLDRKNLAKLDDLEEE